MVKKVLLWGVVSAVAVAGVLALLTFTYFWRSPNYYDAPAIAGEVEDRIVGQAEYSEGHDSPFFFRAGNVVVFGAEHTKDPNDPQIALIDKLWDQLDPTVALVEGRLGFLAPGLMDPVETYGEPGHVLGLAKEHNADAFTWEMPEEELVAALAERHPKERVALFMVLRPYFSNYATANLTTPRRSSRSFWPAPNILRSPVRSPTWPTSTGSGTATSPPGRIGVTSPTSTGCPATSKTSPTARMICATGTWFAPRSTSPHEANGCSWSPAPATPSSPETPSRQPPTTARTTAQRAPLTSLQVVRHESRRGGPTGPAAPLQVPHQPGPGGPD